MKEINKLMMESGQFAYAVKDEDQKKLNSIVLGKSSKQSKSSQSRFKHTTDFVDKTSEVKKSIVQNFEGLLEGTNEKQHKTMFDLVPNTILESDKTRKRVAAAS